ncbi:hypothetical protein HW877_16205 [Serratia marcescens]|uniref:AbiTii domain-containing protein n=1 Tax=Serratia marcescens TaxID=615 RepID=UPI000B5E7AD5|nr:hypothetical protein [Serratia marcescens]ASM17533.1 hypothetical protein BVG90_12725 [Serratia marcescens]MBY4848595.1 hypothetical protein [Serratia marcescens]MCH9866893.1 hypothetical protein [Serratia marcescens]TXE41126.1 hypothetical protein FOT61_09880 [Serratia marcescens]UOO28706.1 hypothetical protein HW877_16205 [Serratia marcescens]
MSLLHQIQEAVLQDGSNLGSVLLKLRLLAARLGSNDLEEWVRHESEGYPHDAVLPEYRVVGVIYKGTFSGPFGSGIKNAPIPPILIQKFAGDDWNTVSVRESIAAVGELVKASAEGGFLGINASNLILLLQGKIYNGYACNDISGEIPTVSLSEISQAVRSRVLELTIEIEKSIPAATHITFGTQNMDKDNASKAQQITQQIIYGNVGNAISGGSKSNINVTIQSNDRESIVNYLKESGISEKDASEFALIVESEKPASSEEPFGDSAKNWIASNIRKAADGTWKAGVAVATKVLTEAALKYYGLK